MRAVAVDVTKDRDPRSSCFGKQGWGRYDKVTYTKHGKKQPVRKYRCSHCRLWHIGGNGLN